MCRQFAISTLVIIIGLHVFSLVVGIMATLMIHRHDRSKPFKDTLLAMSAITVVVASVGSVLLTAALVNGWFSISPN
jgi:ABC-type spermidine/putrescine transport system permease subunit II